jgi:hypothetical protein
MAALLAQAKPWDAGALLGSGRVGEGMQVACSDDRVVIESLDALQAPVGFEADLPQCGQIHKTFTDVAVTGVVDGGFGLQRSSFLVVLLDGGVFIVSRFGQNDRALQPAGSG